MTVASMWLSEREASRLLRVDGQTLELLREVGYLKPGSHWKSSTDPRQLPWKPKVLYLISACNEVIKYWQDNNVYFDQIVA
tara:strand:+ start:475 stop:717 length:243 start_codon:yes stop_codon:yes gene_type:complete